MKLPKLGIRGKSLFYLLVLSLISFTVIVTVAIYYMNQIADFARLSNLSLGNTAAGTSADALAKQSEAQIQQKAGDVAEEVRIYLMGHYGLTPDALFSYSDFAKIGVQTIGRTGYTFLYEKQTAILRLSPDPNLINFDMHQYQTKSLSFWRLFDISLDGTPASGYCDWPQPDGTTIPIYLCLVPVAGTNYMEGAGMQVDEFTLPSAGIKAEINAAAISYNDYIIQQKADMYRVFVAVIAGLLVIVAALAFWLARRITGPIMALTEGSRIIAAGNFDHQVNVKTGDEIEQLAQQYNSMADTLKESYADLEKKVATRTLALRESNALLQKEVLQRQQIEKALRQSEIKYRHLVETANCIIMEIDTQGKVTFFNRFAQEFFGYQEYDILGKSVVGTIIPKGQSGPDDRGEILRDIALHPEKYAYGESENVRRNGEKVWVVWLDQPIYDSQNNLIGILCIGMDRTDLKHAEELREKQAQESAASAERNRLARDLHDAVSQTLFSASIIADVLPILWQRNPEEGKRRLAEIRELTRGALAEMRTLLLELRPAALIESDLGALLHQLGESVTGRARIPVSVEVIGKFDLPTDVKITYYRIAQEALNNVVKHSGGTLAKVSLVYGLQAVELSVSDNGKGFDPSIISPDSLGVGIMQERAKNIGASFEVHSEIGAGSRITVVWHKPSG
jgi:PAS domain S-box-containing protein